MCKVLSRCFEYVCVRARACVCVCVCACELNRDVISEDVIVCQSACVVSDQTEVFKSIDKL